MQPRTAGAAVVTSQKRPRTRMRRRVSFLIAASVAVLATACGGSPTTSTSSTDSKGATQGTQTVSVQVYPGTIWSVPVYAAQHEGFFQKNHIKADFVPAQTGPAAIAALTSGSVDTISVSPEVILGAISRGLKADVYTGTLANPWEVLIAKSVTQKGSDYPGDLHTLKGLTVGVPTIPSAGQAVLDAALLQAGMQPSDVQAIAVGIGAPALAALSTGRIQGLVIQQPISEEAINQAGARVLMDPRKGEIPAALKGPYIGQWALDSFAKSHPAVIKGLTSSFAEADSWLANPSNSGAVAKLLESVYKVPGLDYTQMASDDASLWSTGYTKQALQTYDAYDVKYGFMKSQIPVSALLWQGS